jgi:hypothetical protein
MTKSEQIDQLSAALVKAQKAVKPAVKDSKNPYFKSSYADLSSIWDACRKAISDNDLAVVQFPVSCMEGVGVETILIHSSGQWLARDFVLPMAKADAQGGGSCITYARRYAMAAVMGVCTEDDDGEGAVKNTRQVRESALAILKTAAQKGSAELELAWKSISQDMRIACKGDLAGLKAEAAKVNGGTHAAAR